MPPPSPPSLRFRAVDEEAPGSRWQRRFRASWPAYQRWFMSEGDQARPGFITCRDRLREFMPELVPTWEQLVDLAGGGDQAARMLSLYRPAPYLTGCSQAIRSGKDPVLVRNYDFHPQLCEGTITRTRWNDVRVLGMTDCLWGILDGINESGLAVSLAFGGSKAVGDGFGIPLVLRYILETCESVASACDVLRRVPSHMAYNIALLDEGGNHATVMLTPGRDPRVTSEPISTNHQEEIVWEAHAEFVDTQEREAALSSILAKPRDRDDRWIDQFLQPPLFQTKYRRGAGTLYTAVYRPAERAVTYRWPGFQWKQSLDRFHSGELLVHYREPQTPPPASDDGG